ncbi:MAG: acyltransferase [Devosia sp.]
MITNAVLGENVVLHHPELINLYNCVVGPNTSIGPFVEIQRGATIGARCKISSHCFICEGVTIEDDVFVGHGVVFTNDRYPRAVDADGKPITSGKWKLEPTLIRRGASIGSNATILPGLTIGEDALIGAGAVVTRDVPDETIVVGVPAHRIGSTRVMIEPVFGAGATP